MARPDRTANFDVVFERLKGILEPYGKRMYVMTDPRGMFGVDMAPEGERNPTSWFGGVRSGRRYVSFYLMPVYVEPSLLDGISPELRSRMQGKSCFNFTRLDERLFSELEDLTRRSFERAGGDPRWGVERRKERGMAHRRAMNEQP